MIEIVVFPKLCACCLVPLYRVEKMGRGWYECRNQRCVVWQLQAMEIEKREAESQAFLTRLSARRARGER